MSNLVELLTEAFEEEPRRPADSELATGIRAAAYWSFAPSLEVVVAEADRPPADGHALRAWRARLDRRPIPLSSIWHKADSSARTQPNRA